MRVIAIYSVKGGVGKTTIAANLAWSAATISRRTTLLWDLDPAGGAGFLLGMPPTLGNAAASLFSKQAKTEELAQHTAFPRLDLLPADESLRDVDSLLAQLGKRSRLAKLTEDLAKRYDRVFLDCPPVLNRLSAQILRAADCIIAPMPPSPLSTRALDEVVRQATVHGKKHPPVLPVLAMVDLRRALHRQTVQEHPEWPVIPFASAIEQCAVLNQPIGAFAPRSPGAQSFARLWTAIERRLCDVPNS